jgi:hypothetical protein
MKNAGGAGRVHVANEPAEGTSRMMYSTEANGLRRVGLVVHGEEDPGHDLHDQHERASEPK